MQRFVGRHERQVDDKGRLALPSAFRPRFEPRCFLAKGQDGCIDVLTEEGFDAMVDELLDKVRRGELSRAEQRALSGDTSEVILDAQGRFVIPQELREYAGIELKAAVTVAGSFDRVELWNPNDYQRQIEQGSARIKGASN
jgi:MraZ protein